MRNLSLLVVFIGLLGCSSSKSANKNEAISTETNLVSKDVIISFEQTACYGTCPVHKLIIYTDGSAVYNASRHTEILGVYTAQFSKSELKDIFKKAEEFDFYSAEKEYTAPMTDLPTSKIFIANGIESNQVSAYGEYPSNITSLINYFNNLINSKTWIKAE